MLTDVRRAYYDVLIAQRKVEVAGELVRVSASAVSASQALLRAAEISRIALLQAEIEAEQTNVTRRQAENESEAAWRTLSTVVGVPQLERRSVAGSLEDVVQELSWQDAYEQVLRESPEIGAALAEIQRARAAVDRA